LDELDCLFKDIETGFEKLQEFIFDDDRSLESISKSIRNLKFYRFIMWLVFFLLRVILWGIGIFYLFQNFYGILILLLLLGFEIPGMLFKFIFLYNDIAEMKESCNDKKYELTKRSKKVERLISDTKELKQKEGNKRKEKEKKGNKRNGNKSHSINIVTK